MTFKELTREEWQVEYQRYLNERRDSGKTRVLSLELKPHHFKGCIWGDIDCNPISFAIAEALNSGPVKIRQFTGSLAPLNKTRIPLPTTLSDLYDNWCYSLTDTDLVGTRFSLEVPEDWFDK